MRLVLLAVCAFAVATPALAQTDPSFASCAPCHSLEKGKMGVGPSLAGVVGAKKAAAPGYAYSAALKAKGGVWTAKELDAYLASPSTDVPGTKIPIGQADPAKRAAVIAYLKTRH